MQFVRWLKTGKRNHDNRILEPKEIFNIKIRKVAQRITQEDLLTDDEEQEILDACGDNLRNKAMISLHMEAGDRSSETLNSKLGHFNFLDNDGVIFYVDGKTEDRPIHLLKCVPDLAAWFAVHPRKGDKYAPTWITSTNSHLRYGATRKIIQNAVEFAIKKKQKIGQTSSLSNKRVLMTLMRKKVI